jgi:hypothetical protein
MVSINIPHDISLMNYSTRINRVKSRYGEDLYDIYRAKRGRLRWTESLLWKGTADGRLYVERFPGGGDSILHAIRKLAEAPFDLK